MSQGPNRSNMVVRANSEIELEKEKEEESVTATEEEKDLEYAIDGEILIIKLSLSLQSVENE